MVYSGLYPVERVGTHPVLQALDKLQLNAMPQHLTRDYEAVSDSRCGFLGLLHMEITRSA